VSPIKNEHGVVVGASKIVRDISDRKAAETTLIEKEKLAAAGRMAATLAHEVNNPLEAIINISYLLSNHPSLDEEARAYARILVQEVQRAGDITRQTLSFYRESRLSTDVDVGKIIEHVIHWKTKKLDKKHIRLSKESGAVPLVNGYAGELRQVFENLIENAIDATGDYGHIRVRTRAHGRGENRKVVVSVCDTGTGIPRDVIQRIFDPFFTTKLKTGSGLGLWVTRSIVQKHGGTIRVRTSESSNKRGSVFTVVLPVCKAARLEPHEIPSVRVA
jgi:two-component system, chemotaxis family, CheB/CheR fusion protein